MDTGTVFRFVLLLHLVSVVVAFGPTLLYPLLARRARAGVPGDRSPLADVAAEGTTRLALPGMAAVLLTGVLLVVVTDGVDFADTWISIAFLLIAIAALILGLLLRPNQKRIAELATTVAGGGEGVEDARREIDERQAKAAAYFGALHLVFLLSLIDMIWKPGA